DCARTARRLGAAEVGVSCLECCDEMPADILEIEQAREEGIEIYDSRTFTKIVSNGGKVTGVGCLEITGCTFDDDGQAHFDVVSDEEHTLEADTVIFAIGQVPEINSAGIVKVSNMGTIAADPETLMLETKGVFVAGDCYSGVASIIDAIAGGQKSASKIHRYLQGDVLRVRPIPEIAATQIKVDIPSDTKKKDRQAMPLLSASERVSNFKAVSLGFSEDAAIAEAERCLNCAGHLCKDVCPYSAPQFIEEEKARMQKCNYCVDRFDVGKQPICVEACYARALDCGTLDELKSKYGDIRESPGFSYSVSAKPSIVFRPKKK
ncbi:MAG: FAD-dependent oxidoreductase, partial [Candidatus Lokiarchaeota archaeon]|nr:FAD-dependent oxidoreductase [Candidatus Lokiarchaeota archaeon]